MTMPPEVVEMLPTIGVRKLKRITASIARDCSMRYVLRPYCRRVMPRVPLGTRASCTHLVRVRIRGRVRARARIRVRVRVRVRLG